MAAKQTINLTSIFESVVHFEPIIQYKELVARIDDNHALYALSGDTSDGGEHMSLEIKNLGNRTKEWVEASKNTYSSPTNIKRLVLTTGKCIVEYHTPPVRNGVQDKTKLQSFSVGGIYKYKVKTDVNLIGAIKEQASKWNIDPAYNQSQFKVIGSVLKTLISPWVASNIEEVIIDKTLMISENLLTKTGGKLEMSKDILTSIILDDLKAGSEKAKSLDEINKQLPRLSRIVFAANLANTIKDIPEGKTTYAELSKAGVLQYPIEIKFPAADLKDVSLTIRSYYQFDKEYLSEYNRKAQREFEQKKEAEAEAKRRAAEEEKQRIEASKTEFEKKLEEIEGKYGTDVVRSITEMLVQCHKLTDPEDDIQSIMTTDGWKKYFQ